MESRGRFFAAHNIDILTQKEVEQLLAFDPGFTLSLERDIFLAATGALARGELHDTLCGPIAWRRCSDAAAWEGSIRPNV